tara:strand:+ start:2506 stop:2898 length:393 start_codon:yes stop_codon:yes gene_type:complete
MFTQLIAKLLKKKIYKSQITMVGDDFVAEYHNDSLLESLKWTLHGIHEANATQPEDHPKKGSATNGIFGQISEFKILNVTKSSIGVCGYSKPNNEDIMFMTEQMVYIPEKILTTLKKQEATVSDLDTMSK